MTKKYDKPKAPHRRATAHDVVDEHDKTILADTYKDLNPAAIQRQIQALTSQLLTATTWKKGPGRKPPTETPTRASTDESTKMATRAS